MRGETCDGEVEMDKLGVELAPNDGQIVDRTRFVDAVKMDSGEGRGGSSTN